MKQLNSQKVYNGRMQDILRKIIRYQHRSDSLNFLGHNNRIVLAKLFTFNALVVKLATMSSVITMLSAIKSTAATRKTCKSDPFFAHLTAAWLILDHGSGVRY